MRGPWRHGASLPGVALTVLRGTQNMRSKSITGAILLIILPAAVQAEISSNVNTKPTKSDLEAWIGRWVTHGDPGSWHAESICSWSRGRDFVICDQLINDQQRSLLIINYDSQAGVYKLVSLGTSRDAAIQTATVLDQVWTVHGTFVQDGKTYRIRGKTDFRHPGIYLDIQEHSDDGGLHWIEDSRGRGQKQCP